MIAQKELAKLLYIDPTTLSRTERGNGNRIRKEIQKKLDELLPRDTLEK